MPKIDLLPCPFCGNVEALKMQTVPSEYRVLCDTVYGGCGASIGWNHRTEEEAVKAWNTRASGWIPCSERMPDNTYEEDAFCPRYMVMTEWGVTEAWFNPNYDVWFTLFWYYTTRYLESEISMERADKPKIVALGKGRVTHWRPIPEPPKGEQK